MSGSDPVRLERDGGLAVVSFDHPPVNLFGTEDLQNAVRSFLEAGPGRATFTGR